MLIVETWHQFELALGPDNDANARDVAAKKPRKMKKKRAITAEDGVRTPCCEGGAWGGAGGGGHGLGFALSVRGMLLSLLSLSLWYLLSCCTCPCRWRKKGRDVD